MGLSLCRIVSVLSLLIGLFTLPCSARHASLYHSRRLSALVQEAPLVLPYHDGPLLSGNGNLKVHLLWYGSFSAAQRSTILDLFASFGAKGVQEPSVSSWWKVTSAYKDSTGSHVFPSMKAGEQLLDPALSLGKNLKKSDLQTLIMKAIISGFFPLDSKALYLVLTAENVDVAGFCMDSCASHDYANATTSANEHQKLPIAWVGNSISKCAGKCAWPFANPKDFGGPALLLWWHQTEMWAWME